MQGGTTFHFVTDGIHAALERATDATRGKDINLRGGPDVAQQYLKAGLIDEMDIHIVPVFLVVAHAFSTIPRGDSAVTNAFASSIHQRWVITNTG
jgi:dihydrofolate reductase